MSIDGTLTVMVDTDPAVIVEFDALIVATVARNLTAKHGLEKADGYYVFTPAFLVSISKELSSTVGRDVTPTIAQRMWAASEEYLTEAQKKTDWRPRSPIGTESTQPNSNGNGSSASTKTSPESKPSIASATVE